MIRAILDWLFPGRVADRLNPTKRVKLHGIRFTIRKLNPMDYMSGAKAMHKVYDLYQKAPLALTEAQEAAQIAKVKEHYRDTFLYGVVSVRIAGVELEPTLKEVKEGDKKIPVSHLLTDWDLAEALYLEIVAFTYGKKKLRTAFRSLKTSSSNAT